MLGVLVVVEDNLVRTLIKVSREPPKDIRSTNMNKYRGSENNKYHELSKKSSFAGYSGAGWELKKKKTGL